VEESFQHVAHHLQMIAVPGELAFQVHEIGRRGVEAIREEARQEP
jgi:hypothetical protein